MFGQLTQQTHGVSARRNQLCPQVIALAKHDGTAEAVRDLTDAARGYGIRTRGS
jgi:hypothetical protein